MKLAAVIASAAVLVFAEPALAQPAHSMNDSMAAPSGQPLPGDHESAPVYSFLRANRLDYGPSQLGARGSWDIDARIGTDEHRLVVKSEGDFVRGKGQSADLQFLYSKPISEFFDFQVGARHLFVPGNRNYFAIGIQGIVPGFIETEATLFVSEKGQASARVRTELDLAWTSRIYSRPSFELEAHASDDRRVGTYAGIGAMKLAIQTRYQLTREVAPYVEVGWEKEFGRAGKLARQESGRSDNAYAVIGVRLLY